MLAAVQRLIPSDRLYTYLHDLNRQLSVIVNSPASGPNLEHQAHKIGSQAGMLGLTRISESARALEDACRSGAERSPALQKCCAAVDDIKRYAIPAIAR